MAQQTQGPRGPRAASGWPWVASVFVAFWALASWPYGPSATSPLAWAKFAGIAALAVALGALAVEIRRSVRQAERIWQSGDHPLCQQLASMEPLPWAVAASEAMGVIASVLLGQRIRRLVGRRAGEPAPSYWANKAAAVAERSIRRAAEQLARQVRNEIALHFSATNPTLEQRAEAVTRLRLDDAWHVRLATRPERVQRSVLTFVVSTEHPFLLAEPVHTMRLQPVWPQGQRPALGRALAALLHDDATLAELLTDVYAAADANGLTFSLSPRGTALIIVIRRSTDIRADADADPALDGTTSAATDLTATAPAPEPVDLRPGGPPLRLLAQPARAASGQAEGARAARALSQAMDALGIQGARAEVAGVGPTTVTLAVTPPAGVGASRIVSRTADLMAQGRGQLTGLSLVATDRGLTAQVVRQHRDTVALRALWSAYGDAQRAMALPIPLGVRTDGATSWWDLAQAPHLLIGGTTGSGKSVFSNGYLLSLIATRTCQQVKLVLIDPKGGVELGVYNGIPHLLGDVVTDYQNAAQQIDYLVGEMESRNHKFVRVGARNLDSFNQRVPEEQLLPRIVCHIDECNDLFLAAEADGGREARSALEQSLTRIAQKARSAGIVLVIATQKPTVESIPSLLRGNLPSKIAFTVTTTAESGVILDEPGAEKLAGRGDMLFKAVGTRPVRVQSPYVSEEETEAILAWARGEGDGAEVEGDDEDGETPGDHAGRVITFPGPRPALPGRRPEGPRTQEATLAPGSTGTADAAGVHEALVERLANRLGISRAEARRALAADDGDGGRA